MIPIDPTASAAFVRYSGPVLTRYVAGFTDETRTRQAPALPNHLAWTLGHCAYTMSRAVERFGGDPLPPDDFADAGGTGAGPERYDFRLLRRGTVPTDDPSLYPTLDRCRAVFERAVERLAAQVEAVTPEDLASDADWGGTPRPLGEIAMRVSLHNATHAGQIADLRRALAMPPVFG